MPWRGPGPGRPDVPLPPDRMPFLRGGRPLKEWTYVGAFGPDVMLVAARARIAGIPVSWWAVWDRAAGRLVMRSTRGRQVVHVTPRSVSVDGRFALELGDGVPVEVVSRHGGQYVWTRKRGGLAAHGWLSLNGERRPLELRAIVDETAGYHARETSWLWSAGVGVAASGEPVAWNLVDGVHDGPDVSERTVWVAGEPHHVPPAAFAGLSGVGGLRFTAEATRARKERVLLLSSDYEQPFGTFAGELPVAGELREGWGVMERHHARW